VNSFSARFSRVARIISGIFAACLLVASAAAQAPLHQIDLSLNLIYDDDSDPTSGGTWQVAVKTSDFGLADVSFYLENIRNAETPTFLAPRGDVNGGSMSGPNAGFKSIHAQVNAEGDIAHYLHVFQIPSAANPDRPIFYGVGSIVDPEGGVPNFPDAATQFPDATAIGPSIATLTNVLNAPWGTGDVFGETSWDHSVVLATGEFDPGQTPSFLEEVPTNLSDPLGTVYRTLPMTSAEVGSVSSFLTPTYFVRDNLMIAPATGGDYNGDGIVNLADYTVWRDALGATAAPVGSGADGDSSGIVDAGDYTVWKNNFGLSIAPVGGIGAGPVTVPEPQTLIITVLAMLGVGFAGRFSTPR
jgi:hypothetical protein